MVCRFVQQQNVWAAEKSVRQQHLDFVEGSHVFHLLFMQFIADPKHVDVDVVRILARDVAEEHVGKIRMDDVTRGVLPFMAVQFLFMFLMVLFPQLVTVPARWFY